MSNQDLHLPGLPAPLRAEVPPADWQIVPPETLHVTAPGDTDLFFDPQGLVIKQNAPRLVFTPHLQYTLSARVAVDFRSTYDAGVLLVYRDQAHWAKLCFERSPHGQPMVVSVVTNELSDDCNSAVIDQSDVYLRITRLPGAFAFHYSLDGTFWSLVRYFPLFEAHLAVAGFSVQSPTGDSCRASFQEISYVPRSVDDIRCGE